jgi:hypothetical protein
VRVPLLPIWLVAGCWKDENIHVLPVERSDWLNGWNGGLRNLKLTAALLGLSNSQGMPPDAESYHWYLKQITRQG